MIDYNKCKSVLRKQAEDIACELGISVKTLEKHRQQVKKKTEDE